MNQISFFRSDLTQTKKVDPLAVIGLYPTMLPAELRAKYTYPIDIPELAGAGLDKALSALITYLGQKRIKSEPDHFPQKEWSVTLVSRPRLGILSRCLT